MTGRVLDHQGEEQEVEGVEAHWPAARTAPGRDHKAWGEAT